MRISLLFGLGLSLVGCASYQAKPLSVPPMHASGLWEVQVDPASLPFRVLAAHQFDPADGLDETEVAMLAVVNNPDLKLARDDAGVARAQAFSAGLLPDPQLALSGDLNNSGGPGGTRAFSLGLSYDISGLLQRSSAVAAAKDEVTKVDLTLLWQEWQVASQARVLYIKILYGRKLADLLTQARAVNLDRAQRVRRALAAGLLSSDTILPNLTALQDIEKQLFDLEHQLRQNEFDLNQLLGLDPKTHLLLQEGPSWDETVTLEQALPELPRRRPDLIALAAGYGAQDEHYRGAILAQFPALNVGITRGRDNSNVYSNSLGITISLPLLNRNRGAIAIEQATRQKLFDEYQIRVSAARAEAESVSLQHHADMNQLQQVRDAITELSAASTRSELALRSGMVDLLLYASAQTALLAKQAEELTLQQQIAEENVALQTLLGIAPRSDASTGASK